MNVTSPRHPIKAELEDVVGSWLTTQGEIREDSPSARLAQWFEHRGDTPKLMGSIPIVSTTAATVQYRIPDFRRAGASLYRAHVMVTVADKLGRNASSALRNPLER